MAFYEVRQVEAWDSAVFHQPTAADHDTVGAMRPTQNEGGQGVAASGKSQLVEFEQRQVGHLSDCDLAYIASPRARRRAFRCPPQGIAVAHLGDSIAAALEKECTTHLLHKI